MVSTPKPAAAVPATAPTSMPGERRAAALNARVSAYLIDSALLLAFILAFLVAGGALLLFASDFGSGDASDSFYYASLTVFIAGALISWTAFNVALTAWRRQTAGMYIVGLAIEPENGGRWSAGRAALRWIAFHPLLFHPFLVPVWGLLAALVVSLTLSKIVLAVALALVLFCIAAPAAALAAVLLDPGRRALHDRLAGTVVTHR